MEKQSKGQSKTKRVSKKLPWDSSIMNPLLIELKTYYTISKTGSLVIDPNVDKYAFDLWYEANIHGPLDSLCRFQIHKSSAELITDEDAISSIYSMVLQTIIKTWNPEKSANSYGYLTQTIRSYIYDIFTEKGRKHIDTGLTFFRTLSDDKSKKGPKSRKPMYEFLGDHNNSDIQNLSRDNRTLANLIDFKTLAEYIPDCAGTDTHKEIAYLILEILDTLFENPNLIPDTNWVRFVFYERMMVSHSNHVLTHIDTKLIQLILSEALGYWKEDFLESEDEEVYGERGVLWSSDFDY